MLQTSEVRRDRTVSLAEGAGSTPWCEAWMRWYKGCCLQPTLDIRRDHESYRAPAIDVIGTVLSVILNNKDYCIVPESRMGYGFNDHSECLIVRGHHGAGRVVTRQECVRMVFSE